MFKIIHLLTFILLLASLFLQAWFIYTRLPYDAESLIYWLVLANWLLVIRRFSISSHISLGLGFSILAIFSLLHGLTSSLVFEQFLRFGFVFWTVGMVQALMEFIPHPYD